MTAATIALTTCENHKNAAQTMHEARSLIAFTRETLSTEYAAEVAHVVVARSGGCCPAGSFARFLCQAAWREVGQ